jgi:hypothetical protein
MRRKMRGFLIAVLVSAVLVSTGCGTAKTTQAARVATPIWTGTYAGAVTWENGGASWQTTMTITELPSGNVSAFQISGTTNGESLTGSFVLPVNPSSVSSGLSIESGGNTLAPQSAFFTVDNGEGTLTYYSQPGAAPNVLTLQQ